MEMLAHQKIVLQNVCFDKNFSKKSFTNVWHGWKKKKLKSLWNGSKATIGPPTAWKLL